MSEARDVRAAARPPAGWLSWLTRLHLRSAAAAAPAPRSATATATSWCSARMGGCSSTATPTWCRSGSGMPVVRARARRCRCEGERVSVLESPSRPPTRAWRSHRRPPQSGFVVVMNPHLTLTYTSRDAMEVVFACDGVRKVHARASGARSSATCDAGLVCCVGPACAGLRVRPPAAQGRLLPGPRHRPPARAAARVHQRARGGAVAAGATAG